MLESARTSLDSGKRPSFMHWCKLPLPRERGVPLCSGVSLLMLGKESLSYPQREAQFHPQLEGECRVETVLPGHRCLIPHRI